MIFEIIKTWVGFFRGPCGLSIYSSKQTSQMKNLKKLKLMVVCGMVTAITFSSCNKEHLETGAGDDAQLIDEIENAKQVEVAKEDLPDGTSNTLKAEHDFSFINQAFHAQELGYAIHLRARHGCRVGDKLTSYFDEEGRELHRRRRHKIRHMRDCFDLILPVSFTMPDGSALSIENDSSWYLIKEWYQENPDAEGRPEIVLPVEVAQENGDIVTINTQEELEGLKEACRDDHHRLCFEFAFPVTFIMPDNSEIVINSREDRQLIRAWHIANPEVRQRAAIKYPITVTKEDGSSVEVSDKDQLKELRKSCH